MTYWERMMRQDAGNMKKGEALRRDTIKAWEEYEATGLHVTGEEADAWLAKLEEGIGVEPPECHV